MSFEPSHMSILIQTVPALRYVLEQHIKRDEVIFPMTEIGKFRGESVYPRFNVVPLKAAENWMRIGRKVKEGCQAMKWVKQRAVTIYKRRAMELAQQEGDEMMQGLYSEAQTELYIPDPIIDVSRGLVSNTCTIPDRRLR